MKNLKDRRSLTSRVNGQRGGRPAGLDFGSVAKVLVRGLKRLAEAPELRLEATSQFIERQLRNKARVLCAGFDEVIAQSRVEYLKRLDQLGSPNPVEVRNRLRKDLDAVSREVREALRVILVKAEVLLQDAAELEVDLGSDIASQLERISKIEAIRLDQIVDLILGIIEESLDRFGLPLNS